jgi:hypothetical protein
MSPPVEPALYTLAQAATRLAVSPDFLRAHADEFDAVRLTSGPRARIHFRISVIEGVVAGKIEAAQEEPERLPARRQAPASTVDLLPVKGP